MLVLLIKLSGVSVEYSYAGDKHEAVLKSIGNVWINADKLATVRPREEDGVSWTCIGMGDDDFVYVSETPDEIIALIDADRKEIV